MVKPQGGVSPKRPSFLRVDMKRKLPAPFVVSRGYTPEYPWLGQAHPEPAARLKKPKLLMQQSPASIFKCILCVACFILGLALIAYAGSAILRGQFARHAEQAKHGAGLTPRPAAARLVREDPEKETVNVHARHDAGKVELHHEPPPGLGAETTAADVATPTVGPKREDDGVDPTAAHGTIVVRMVDEPRSEEVVIQGEVAAVATLPAAAPAAAAEQDQGEVVSVALGQDGGAEVTVEGQEAYFQEAKEGALEATKDLLLLARMANLAEAQHELQQRARVTEALQDAYDKLQGESSDARGEPGAENVADPESLDLLAADKGQVDEDQQKVQLDAAADAELARQLLLWALTHPEALSEQEQEAEETVDSTVDHSAAAELQQLLLWTVAHPEALSEQEAEEIVDSTVDHPAEERVAGKVSADVIHGVADEPVQAGRQVAQLSHDEQSGPESVVAWTQLNEDDKQDTLMPKLAARGLDGDDLPVAEGEKVAEGVELAVPQEVVPQEADEDESRQLQQYRDLLSRRVPLMHHVLQLRRSQQEALQQEQRATAYLQLLDLHLRQHQQEAAARQRRRQHLRDLQRLQAYALQLQQQDRQLHEQQAWWGQQAPQAYAQQAQQDQLLYNQQTTPGAAAHPTQQQASAAQQQQCVCAHRVARGAPMPHHHQQAAW